MGRARTLRHPPLILPPALASLLRFLEEAGYEAYAVGGTVRDLLLGRPPADLDVATSATPAQVLSLLPGKDRGGMRYGTVHVQWEGNVVEVTTFRGEGGYGDARHPDAVVFGASLAEDLARRDFTVNAVAADARGQVVDPWGGIADLAAGRLRTVGDPHRRMKEDVLRVLRLVRLVAQLDVEPEPATLAAARAAAPGLATLPRERVRAELERLLAGEHLAAAAPVWEKLDLEAVLGVSGESVARAARLGAALHLRWAALLLRHPALVPSFLVGAAGRRAARILEAWQRVQAAQGDAELRAAAAASGEEAVGDLLALRAALSGEPAAGKVERLGELVAREGILDRRRLALSARDLLRLGVPQGPEVGRIQRELLAAVWEDPARNRPEILAAWVRWESKPTRRAGACAGGNTGGTGPIVPGGLDGDGDPPRAGSGKGDQSGTGPDEIPCG